MAYRNSGSKLVVVAVGFTLAAVGVGTIYLPFIADKDKIRGLDEQADLSAAERREYERMMKEMGQSIPAEGVNTQRRASNRSNSMWQRMNQQSSAKDPK